MFLGMYEQRQHQTHPSGARRRTCRMSKPAIVSLVSIVGVDEMSTFGISVTQT